VFLDRSSTIKELHAFGGSESVKNQLKCSVLNENGFDALQKLCYILKESTINLEYNPLVTQLMHFLLLFLHDYETLSIIKYLIEDS